MLDDQQLLRRYAADGSEAAFGELVARCMNLVYSTAVRRAGGDATLAQDVAQLVFIDLARKARALPSGVVLAGWLHRATSYAAAQLLRTERRRQAREQKAVVMNAIASTPDPDWDHIRPLLDEALDCLSVADRDALLLRFFEQRSLAEVGHALCTNEDAARKRVTRALEKLRAELVRRGVKTSASALSTVISANGMLTAPAGLAARFTSASLAATATGSTSTSALFTLITSAKTSNVLAALAVLLLVGGAAVKFYQSNSTANRATVSATSEPAKPALARDPNRLLARRSARPQSGTDTEIDLAVEAALAKVRAALDDPHPTTRFPNPAMQEAIAALGGQREAALPMLREALKKDHRTLTAWGYQVRDRAVDGLGQIGPEAREAVPDLLEILRTNTSVGCVVHCLNAFGYIGTGPEILPNLLQILKENPKADARQFIAHYLPAIVGGDTTSVDELVRPLLQDLDLQVRAAAASTLVNGFKRPADPDVTKVAIQYLKFDDQSSWMATKGMLEIQRIASRDPNNPETMTTTSLGSDASEAIAALIQVANNNPQESVKTQALKLLDGLAPGLRQQSPRMQALLREQEQRDAFSARIHTGQPTVPELIEGLKQFPKLIQPIAKALGRLGPDAQGALPALRDTLAKLEPDPGGATRALPENPSSARAAVANAIQIIAPDRPKPLFTSEDVTSVFGMWTGSSESWPDSERATRILKALQPAMVYLRKHEHQMPPDQMKNSLNALKAVDQSAYEAAAAQVEKIDPRFFAQPTP